MLIQHTCFTSGSSLFTFQSITIRPSAQSFNNLNEGLKIEKVSLHNYSKILQEAFKKYFHDEKYEKSISYEYCCR